jgi:hypothetical protein
MSGQLLPEGFDMMIFLAIIGIITLVCFLPQILFLLGVFFLGIFYLVMGIAAAPIYLVGILGHGLSNLGERLLSAIDRWTK